jgi:hypothetical protein
MIDAEAVQAAGLSSDDLLRLLPREPRPGLGPEQQAFEAALDFVLRADPVTALARVGNVRLHGPDFSQVPIDRDSVFRLYSEMCHHPSSLFALGVVLGAAAQSRYHQLVEQELRRREQPLARGAYAAHGGEEQFRQHVEDWKNEYYQMRADMKHTSKCAAIAKKTPHRNLLKKDALGQPRPFTGRAVSKALAGVGVKAPQKR